MLLAANPLPMWVYDLETLRFVEVNEAAIAHYGYSRDEFLAMSISDIRPEEDRARLRQAIAERAGALQRSGTWRHRRADGTLLDVEVTSHALDWEGRPASLVVAHDVTETHRLQRELARRALYDDATGLANAALFVDRTAAALARAADRGHVGVVVVALSGLDAVAATAGDTAGDALVAEVARRLRACCRAQETLARLGGGRFAVLCVAGDRQGVLRLAESVVVALDEPVAVAGFGELRASPAVGVAVGDDHGQDAAGLVRDATSAMRHAAERGGDSFVVANAELRRAALEVFETEQALVGALRGGQLHLLYQPVVDLHGGEVVACEALVRWERPGIGLVGPDRFVPLAERNGLIGELGTWVIDHAVAEAASWPGRTRHRPRVGINLAARQLHDGRLVERFAAACAASGLSPTALCVELTESAFVATDDYRAYKSLAALRELGVEVAIDDFGTGYSALSYLKHLPLDVVKIDRGFVAGLGTDPADALLIEAIVTVAHGLDLRVVAEGVETRAQLEALRGLGCDAAQGYLLARPTATGALPAVLDAASRAAGGRTARVPAPRRGAPASDPSRRRWWPSS
ncbi:MAG: EAL domain-containing protein [Actinomycetota bacterium]|nr:EAL domain-containing protein [Actinomycetota bacterium]